MEEGIRVTTQKKSKKVQTVLLVITGILGLALIGVAIYFYTIKDTNTNTDNTSNVTCGCYYIDPAVSTECGDPRRAFQFEVATNTSTETCKAACSTSKISINNLNSSTQQDLYQICQLQTISDSRCSSMKITDKNGKIVTGKVSSSDQITVEAVFDKEYSNYKFVINNESVDPDVVTPDKLTIKKTITNLTGTTAINIVGTGTTSDNQQINSPICRRLIEVSQAGESSVTNLQLSTRLDGTVMKISSAKISAGNLSSTADMKISFTFENAFSELVMTKGFTVDTTAGIIEILEQDLYNSANFSNSKSFSQLDGHTGSLNVKAEVYVSNTSIGSASSSVTFPADTTNTNNEPVVASSFTVANTVDLTCVERVTPSNTVQYSINVTNKSTTSQKITSITDKLPLGFTYVAGTTKINGVLVVDTGYTKITTVGSTQEIVISQTNGWTLSANQTLTVLLQAQAGASALTGANKNEVVVTPEEVPTDPSSLRASVDIKVAQDCEDPNATTETPTKPTTPSTGIFDSIIFKVLLGIFVVATGWYIYNRPKGKLLVEKFVDSDLYKTTELRTWKLFKPKKYFEETIIRKSERKR
jgi:uncharacterized repeat protein (TIGR01451 family)